MSAVQEGSAMTQAGCHERVEVVRSLASDPERAHIAEDTLWRDVLIAIMSGADNPRGLAAKALETQLIGFSRWYS